MARVFEASIAPDFGVQSVKTHSESQCFPLQTEIHFGLNSVRLTISFSEFLILNEHQLADQLSQMPSCRLPVNHPSRELYTVESTDRAAQAFPQSRAHPVDSILITNKHSAIHRCFRRYSFGRFCVRKLWTKLSSRLHPGELPIESSIFLRTAHRIELF